MRSIKIFNILQCNFLEANNANKPANPYGKEKRTYDGKSGIYFYVKFLTDDKFKELMEQWNNNKTN